MELNIKIDLGGSAYDSAYDTFVNGEELRRQCDQVIHHFEYNLGEYLIFDFNGNKIGEAFIKWKNYGKKEINI